MLKKNSNNQPGYGLRAMFRAYGQNLSEAEFAGDINLKRAEKKFLAMRLPYDEILLIEAFCAFLGGAI